MLGQGAGSGFAGGISEGRVIMDLNEEKSQQRSVLIQYPAHLMWNLSQQELDAYASIAGRKDPFPFDLLEKYGLQQEYNWVVSPTHYLVCRWLESHRADQEKWRQPEFMYYDILDKAEQEYLGLPPWRTRCTNTHAASST